jgi:hypothetical protein
MASKHCKRLRAWVTPNICKACQGHGAIDCDNPMLAVAKTKKENNTNGRQQRKQESDGERLRKREQAIRLVERRLQATCLYEGTGFSLHSNGEQSTNVLSTERSSLVERSRASIIELDSLKNSATDCSAIDSNTLQHSPI